MKITDTLVAEHRILLGVFAQIERVLPRVRTAAGVTMLASIVEGLLLDHGGTETELAYLALDHVLQDQGRLDRLHQEHQEIDAGLRAVRAAGGRAEAGRRLRAALLASRNHFRFEEQFVFPLLDEALQKETLSELGQAWRQRGKAP